MARTMQRRPGADAPEVHKKPSGRPAPWPVEFYRSAVGKKWAMAISGLAMIGFLIAHLIGNLKIYLPKQASGRYEIDEYSHTLRTLLYPIMPNEVVLWVLRIGLIAMLILHIHAAASLTIMNKRANAMAYQSPRDYAAANFASRSMRYTGVITFLYLVFHILDMTLGKTGATFHEGSVHANMVATMSRWPVAIAYIVANIAIAVHLYHGTWSMFQSMGLNNPRYNKARKTFAIGVASVIGIGNVAFPVMILAGAVK